MNLSVNGQGSQSVMEGVELLSPGGSTVVGDLCITSCGPSDAPDDHGSNEFDEGNDAALQFQAVVVIRNLKYMLDWPTRPRRNSRT